MLQNSQVFDIRHFESWMFDVFFLFFFSVAEPQLNDYMII